MRTAAGRTQRYVNSGAYTVRPGVGLDRLFHMVKPGRARAHRTVTRTARSALLWERLVLRDATRATSCAAGRTGVLSAVTARSMERTSLPLVHA